MRTLAPIRWVVLIVLIIGFLVSVYTILDDRISGSELFPVYSSKRSDPLGVSLFRESLSEWPAIDSVKESRSPTTRLEEFGKETAFLRLGMTSEQLKAERYELDSDFLRDIAAGGRVVISVTDKVRRTVRTDYYSDWSARRDELREEWKELQKEKETEGSEGKETDEWEEWVDFLEEHRVSYEAERRLEQGPTLLELFELSVKKVEGELPAKGYPLFDCQSESTINLDRRWKSRLIFERASDDSLLKSLQKLGTDLPEETSHALIAQRVKLRSLFGEEPTLKNHYETDQGKVVVSGAVGDGEVWFVSDTYPFSNESLKEEPFTELLFASLDGVNEVIFDERIHGAKEAGGFMHVMVAYRLHGIFWGLACVALIWVWRASSSLLPPQGMDGVTDGVMMGEDTASGMQSLLRSGVPRQKLAATLFSCWEESQRIPLSETRKEKVDAALRKLADGSGRAGRDIVAVMEELRCILRSR